MKPDFMDEVSDEMDKGGGEEYGADMEDEDEGDDESAGEDKIMAAKQVAKAAGITVADPKRFADALEAFVKACS
jgi:hypothetical protein